MLKLNEVEDYNGKLYALYVNLDVIANLEKINAINDLLINKVVYTRNTYSVISNYYPQDIERFKNLKKGQALPYLTKPIIALGQPMYRNITELFSGPGSIRIKGDLVVAPELVSIINDLVYGNDGLTEYFDYEFSDDFKSIDEEIAKLTKQVRETSDDDLDTKINLMVDLRSLYEEKNKKECFNVQLLREIYEEIGDWFFLREIDKDNEVGEYMTINDFKRLQMENLYGKLM